MDPSPSTIYDGLRHADNRAAWENFVRAYSPRVLWWAQEAGLQAADAADVLQEVLLTVHEQVPIKKRDPRQKLTGWLKTVTLNKCRDRRKAKKPVLDPEAVNRTAIPDPMEAVVEKESRLQEVKRALKLMQTDFSKTTWEAWLQSEVEGRPAKAIAAELGITVQAVYDATKRVKTRLRQQFPKAQD